MQRPCCNCCSLHHSLFSCCCRQAQATCKHRQRHSHCGCSLERSFCSGCCHPRAASTMLQPPRALVTRLLPPTASGLQPCAMLLPRQLGMLMRQLLLPSASKQPTATDQSTQFVAVRVSVKLSSGELCCRPNLVLRPTFGDSRTPKSPPPPPPPTRPMQRRQMCLQQSSC